MNLEKYAHIYFDTNFLALVRADSGQKLNTFNESCQEYGLLKKNYQPVVTPFIFLESIGLSMKNVGLPTIRYNLEIKSIDDLDILKNEIFEQAYIYYSTHSSLSKEKILEHVNNQHCQGSEFGKKLFKDIISINTQIENFEHHIYWTLAYDYIQKHLSYPKHINEILIHSFLIDLGKASFYNLNISQARIIRHIWDKHVGLFLRNKDITLSQKKRIKKGEYCFKVSSDLVDTEITHFANTGWLSNHQYHPVMCITCDENIEKIKFRLAMYKSQVASVCETLKDFSPIPFHKFEFQPGVVIMSSRQTGQIREIIEVEKLSIII